MDMLQTAICSYCASVLSVPLNPDEIFLAGLSCWRGGGWILTQQRKRRQGQWAVSVSAMDERNAEAADMTREEPSSCDEEQ